MVLCGSMLFVFVANGERAHWVIELSHGYCKSFSVKSGRVGVLPNKLAKEVVVRRTDHHVSLWSRI